MIPVDNLLYGVDQKLNKLSSLINQQISKEDKILALDKAQTTLILRKLNANNNLQIGFDGNKKRMEDLQVLIEAPHQHPLDLKQVDVQLNKWEADISLLLPKYMFYVDSYVLASKGNCKDNIIWVNHSLSKHGDVSILLNNSFYKPSFEWQETFSTMSDGKIEIYTDGTFNPSKIYISYIRYPKQIDSEGYIKINGEESKNQDSELPDYLEEELLDLAVIELGWATENIPATQASGERLKIRE